MWQAIHDQKWDEVEHHLAPTFVGVCPNGQKFDRAGWVEYWKGRPAVDSSLGELNVQPNGADSYIHPVNRPGLAWLLSGWNAIILLRRSLPR